MHRVTAPAGVSVRSELSLVDHRPVELLQPSARHDHVGADMCLKAAEVALGHNDGEVGEGVL